MISKFSMKLYPLLAFSLCLCGYLSADAINLVVNGNFAGDLTGWTADQQNPDGEIDGVWEVYTGNDATPLPPPPEGTYAAYSFTSLISSMVLYQDIALPEQTPLTLQYTYYYEQNPLIDFVTQPTLFVSRFFQNQQARIDIMNPLSDPFSVDSADVWLNLFQTQPGDPFSVPYTTVSFDLSSFAGQTIRLRFAVADSRGYLFVGVDGVRILADTAVEPPADLTGEVFKNRFLTQKERMNHIQWLPSPTPGVVAYYVFRNGRLLATIPSTAPLMYNDHNRSKKQDVYSVIAVNNEGVQSEPVTIILP